MIEIKIKPMSVNQVWQGKRFRTTAYDNYEKALMYMLPKKLILPEPPFLIELEFGFSSAASDWDNPIKPFQDVLAKKYKFNDKLIKKGIVTIQKVKKGQEFIRFSIENLK
jgi:hypothetical protein